LTWEPSKGSQTLPRWCAAGKAGGFPTRLVLALVVMTLLRSAALGLVALLVPWSAVASLVQAMDLAELTAGADRIVVAQVVSTNSEWDSSGRNIHTRIEIKVAETWKGSVAVGQRMIIVQPGGSVGDIEMHVHGMPSFAPGEKAVLFLAGQGAPRVVGMSQGKRPLRWDGTAKRWVAEAAEYSAVVRRDSQGRLQPATPEPAMELDELRQRVRALVRP